MLVRLDDEYGNFISQSTREEIVTYLEETRELIIAAQYENGSWPSNWLDGAKAQINEDPDEMVYRRVISTGHHLEWLAIAPKNYIRHTK